MDIDEIEEQIRKYKTTRQVQYESIMDAFREIETGISEITTCNEVIEGLLRQEIEELRKKVYVENRTLK